MLSKMKVMQSNTGYYIGRTLDGEPYERLTDYMSKEEAKEFFKAEICRVCYDQPVQLIDPKISVLVCWDCDPNKKVYQEEDDMFDYADINDEELPF